MTGPHFMIDGTAQGVSLNTCSWLEYGSHPLYHLMTSLTITYSDEAHKLPRRLTELVEHYPYASGADAWNDNLLPRPRFSTRDYDALFVRLDTEYIGALKPKSHPLRLIADALRAQSAAESATVEDADLWDTIKKASLILDTPEGTSYSHTRNLSSIFLIFFLTRLSAFFLSSLWMYQIRAGPHRLLCYCHRFLRADHVHSLPRLTTQSHSS
jgi:hypothetical protein